MSLLKRSKPAPQAPAGRQVNMLGRTMPYSYHARRSAEPSAVGRQLLNGSAVGVRRAKRAAHYWRQRFGLLLILIAAVLGTGNLLALDTNPVVMPATASSQAFLHPLGTYQRRAAELLGGSLLNRNKITVDTGAITAGLERSYPELSIVSITLPLFGHRPVIYVAQADPALLLTAANGQTFVIDTQGRAIAPGAAAQPSQQLLTVRDESGAAARLGQQVLPSTTVSFIKTVHFQLAQRQVGVRSFVLPAGGNELDIYLRDERYYIKCNLASGTAVQQAGTFLAVQKYFEGRGTAPRQYVDVRLDGRAYYK